MMLLITALLCLLVGASAVDRSYRYSRLQYDRPAERHGDWDDRLESRLNNVMRDISFSDRDFFRSPKESYRVSDSYVDTESPQVYRQMPSPNRVPYAQPQPRVPARVESPSVKTESQRPQAASNGFTITDLYALETRLNEEITRNTEMNIRAAWLRLAFHDCGGELGCDGCIDPNDNRKTGTDGTIRRARMLYDEINPKLSFADFVALLGTVAAKSGADVSGGALTIPFSTGRKDCVPPVVENEFPAGQDLNGIQFLSKRFQLTTEEAVALLGGHSLGGAKANQSGFSGPWDSTPRSLDSAYYSTLLQQHWNLTLVNNNRTRSSQWNAGNLLMLHADMILLKDFTTSGPNHTPSCLFATCPDNPLTSNYVRTFARDQSYWLRVFSRAFLKMVATGNFQLTPVR